MTQNNIQEFSNMVDVLHASVERFREHELFGEYENGEFVWTTYGEFQILVDHFRAGLASLGIGEGDAVAVIANNRLEWAVGSHAVYGLGAKYVPMYEAQKDAEWEYILSDSGSVACLVANSDVEVRIKGMQSRLTGLRSVVNFEGHASDTASYVALLEYGARHARPALIPESDAVATLIYTSGTTGNPKGVVLTHANLAANVNAMVKMVEVGTSDRGLAFLPWAHVFGGCVELNLVIALGSSTGICGDAQKLVQYMPLVRPTVLFAVPRVWNKIHSGVCKRMAAAPKAVQWMFNGALEGKAKLRRGETLGLSERIAIALADKIIFPKVRAGMGGQLRFAVSGAAALSREVAEFMVSLGIEVHEGYGLTETGGGATAQPDGAVRLGSVGVALPGVRLELDTSVEGAGPNEGEVVIHGANVTAGYHNLPAETEQALTQDGGLRTGDLGRIDEDGYLFITGRAKELYKLENGRYVAPVPLEGKLELSPFISQAIVTGQDKPHNVALIVPDLEAVHAWAETHQIAGDDDALLSDPRLLAILEEEVEQCNSQFKGYERIASFVVDREELSAENGLLTQTMKPKRRKIVQKYESDFDSLYPGANEKAPVQRASYINELRARAKSA